MEKSFSSFFVQCCYDMIPDAIRRHSCKNLRNSIDFSLYFTRTFPQKSHGTTRILHFYFFTSLWTWLSLVSKNITIIHFGYRHRITKIYYCTVEYNVMDSSPPYTTILNVPKEVRPPIFQVHETYPLLSDVLDPSPFAFESSL